LNKQIKSVDFLLAWYRHNLPYLVKKQITLLLFSYGEGKYHKLFLARKTKMSQLLARTSISNIINSAKYEKVKYQKFYTVRTILISQICPSTKHKKCHNFCLVRNIQISHTLHSTNNSNTCITNSTSYEKDSAIFFLA
jgi:hypothetical protein